MGKKECMASEGKEKNMLSSGTAEEKKYFDLKYCKL
jgi:hypothetical protein